MNIIHPSRFQSTAVSTALLCAALLANSSPNADAAQLEFYLVDPVGDETTPVPFTVGAIDLIGLHFTFEDTTGDYTATLTATGAKPFFGDFRINLNLYNPDTGFGTLNNPSFFQDTFNDFNLVAPQTTLTLTGTNTRLLNWGIGDRVAPNGGTGGIPENINLGVPDGSSIFRSNLQVPAGGSDSDVLSFGQFTTIAAVPEPGSATLLLGGLALWGLRRRR